MMIGDIAQMIGAMLVHYCANQDMKVTLHYDPRESREDRLVFDRIEEIVIPLASQVMGKDGIFLGCENAADSHSSAGLQMVDHVTRDLRQFHVNPRLLTDGSNAELITSDYQTSVDTVVTWIGDRPFKLGESVPIAADLVRHVFSNSTEFTLADYHNILMKKRVSCFTEAGEARIVNFEDFSFQNMVD